MKVCVATNQGGLKDQLSQFFGRCQTFTFVEVEGEDIKDTNVIQNQFASARGGAGIQAAQLVVNEGAEVVIAGNFGPNAFSILNQGGVKTIATQGGVRDAVMRFAKGQLKPTIQSTTPRFKGKGLGMGRGMGTGRGAGMGTGRGMGRQSSPQTPSSQPFQPSSQKKTSPSETPNQNKEQEIEVLEKDAEELEKRLQEIRKRIEELKK